MEKELLRICERASYEMRIDSLNMARQAESGAHLGGGLSMIELLAVLYLAVMKTDSANPYREDRDRFILSKGHGVLAYYAALVQAGYILREELASFKSNQTFLYGHPSMNVERGIEFSSGSLGQGLSLGVGSALAMQRKKNNDAKVYVLLGDGECEEGSVWEAAMSAAHFNLKQVVVMIDCNGLQYDGETNNVLSLGAFAKKWSSFGWEVREVDGHNCEQIYNALIKESNLPLAIIANTVKGKGVSFMEHNPIWHHARLSAKQYEAAIAELEVRNGRV